MDVGQDPPAQLDCAVLVTEPWRLDIGCVTPTFQVQRHRVEEVDAVRQER